MATLSSPVSPVSALPRASVLSLDISLASYHSIQEAIIAAAHRHESRTACFANVHMTVEGTHDAAFARIVNEADWVTADGVPLTWAIRLLDGLPQERVAGIDMLPDLVRRAAEDQLPVFFYGSTPDVLAKTVAVCQERYPALQLAGTLSPPFRPLTQAEEIEVIDTINASGARLVFVALGCPKQERWMAQMRGRIQAVMLGIGGALPILAGTQSRSPRWMQQNGLEWVFRLAVEPRRLFKRYAVTNSLFLLYLTRQFWRTKRGADSRRQHNL
ncbi:WecB/TagA/CpsF family glycosyltransferase [Fibrella sp. WM1]|uniref:WecB/TagA/CpsF family glycosyltransferase n=1 Tax=Fibrella musci TaxID=3242485 RepID=UPI00351F8C88